MTRRYLTATERATRRTYERRKTAMLHGFVLVSMGAGMVIAFLAVGAVALASMTALGWLP
jgi:hypothetical protein